MEKSIYYLRKGAKKKKKIPTLLASVQSECYTVYYYKIYLWCSEKQRPKRQKNNNNTKTIEITQLCILLNYKNI